MVHDVMLFLAWIAAIILILPLTTFCLEVFLGLGKRPEILPPSVPYSAFIIMPAHDEASILGDTLDRLRPVLPQSVSVLVVADNCADETANIAKERGVTVVERRDTDKRGKGYALDFGREWLKRAPPDCVIVLDADCATDKASLEALIVASLQHQRPIQANYTFTPDLSAPPKVQISNFALWLKNVVRQKGAQRLGGGAILTGTGMAFPWAIFETLPLATNSIVEDLELGVELTSRGSAALFLESAHVTSAAASETATLAQRARWEHGFITVARRYSFPTLVNGLKAHSKPLILLGLHLLVPPLALLMTVASGITVLLFIAAIWAETLLPAVIVTGLTGAALCCVFAAWASGGHRWLSARSMLMVPLYVLWKLPVYLRLVTGRRSEWTRTDRSPS